MKLKFLAFLAALCISLLGIRAQAAEVGLYVGAGLGYADVITDDDEDDVEDFFTNQGLTADVDNDTSNFNFRIFGGYQFHPNFGVEFAYVTLGEADIEADVTAPVVAHVETDSDVDGFEFVATGAYPISDNVDLTARLGGIYYDAEVDVEVTGAAAGTLDLDDDGVVFTGGVGFARRFADNWIWRGGWQYVDTDNVNHLFMTGIAYQFGN